MSSEPIASILLPDLRPGGVERLSILLAREFIRRGYGVEFVLRQAQGELLTEVPAGVAVVDLKSPRIRNIVVPFVGYLRRRRPAMLLAAMWPVSGIAPVTSRLAGVKCRVVVSEHTLLSQAPSYRGASALLHRTIGAAAYRMAAGVVCVSEGARQDLVALTGLRPEQVHVIYNPIRRPSTTAAPAAREIADWWLGAERKVIAVGSLKPAKDYPTLLRAFAKLRKARSVRLLILGEGGEREALEGLIGELGLGKDVRLGGFVPDPYPYLEQADLFVLSSAWEGFGNVIVEALVCGVPVVSTDCPSGPAEILENGRYGRLVPVGDPEALAAAMADALDATHDREMLRRRGAEFSVERAADQYLALLDPDGAGRARQ